MKTSLSLIFAYFAICIFGTAAGSVLYMMYGDLTLFVAGQSLSFFSANLFMKGVFFVCPLVCAFSSLFMVLYFVRHPVKNFLPIIAYILTGIISWGFVIPFAVQKSSEYKTKTVEQKKDSMLSAGFFREDRGGIYYYSRVGIDGKADGLYIDLQGFTGEQGKVIPFENAPVNKDAAYPFSDLLIRDAVSIPHFIHVPMEMYKKQLSVAQKAVQNGYISWLCFASVGIALLSIFMLRKFSSWRLLSACVSTAVFIAVAFLNCSFYGGALSSFEARCSGWWSSVSLSFPSWLLWASKIQNPFVVFMNLFICLLIVAAGIGSAILKKHLPPDSEVENA